MRNREAQMLFASARTLVAIALCSLVSLGPARAAIDKCPVQGGSVRAAMAGTPPTLDFISSFAAQALDIGVYLYEGLLTLNDKYEVAPQLAERWSVGGDGLTYTFQLRRGVKFHDGSAVTADDVVASFERFLAQSPRNGWALYGLARSEDALGRKAEAEAARQAFVRAWAGQPQWLRMERL